MVRKTRSFCFVDDLVEGFLRFMATDETVTGPLNLANPAEFTMLELAELILELTARRSTIIHLQLPMDDPKQRQPDIAMARQQLGWEPNVALREGLERTIAYFRRFT